VPVNLLPVARRKENRERREITFQEQQALADTLLRSEEARNKYNEGYGGFYTFADT
jgi:hypothetical protein